MHILYVTDVPFTIRIRKGGDVTEFVFDTEFINWCWEIWEGIALSKYFDVTLVNVENVVLPNDFDLIYIPSDSCVEVAWEIAEKFNKPVVMQCISAPPREVDKHWRNVLKFIESNHVLFLTCVSPFVCREWSRYLNEKDIDKEVIYVPHGVNDIVANNVNVCPSSRSCYVTIAKLMPWKKVDVLIKTFGKLLRDDLLIIGDGPMRRELEKLNIIYLSPAKFLGVVDELTKFELLANAKAYVQASESEQFSIPVVEACYMATPCVVYRQDVVYEIHRDNPAVIFWENEDELVKAIEKIDSLSTNEINELGLRGRDWVVKQGMTLTQRSEKLANMLIEWLKK